MGKKMTQEEYITKVEEWNIKNYGKKDVFTVEDKYISTGIKVRVKHNVEGCGVVREVYPSIYSRGHSCKECGNTKVGTDVKGEFYDKYLELKEYFKKMYGNSEEYIILGQPGPHVRYVQFKHNIEGCGHTFNTRGELMLEGKRCSQCYNVRRGTVAHNRKSEEDFLREVKESNVKLGLKEDDYIFLEKYRGRHTKIQVKHTDGKCNREYGVRPGDFFRGNRCAKCEGMMKRTQEQFEKEVEEINYNRSGNKKEYIFTGVYTNVNTKLDVEHTSCGHKYSVSPATFIHGRSGCPKCSSSAGEKGVESVLEMLGENYISQYPIILNEETGHWFRSDFAIEDDKGGILGVIEYDGEHHYEPIGHFGGEEFYNQVKERDKLKNDYCEINNIPLLRIPYWEFKNIRSITEEFVEKIKTGLNK